MRKTISIVTPCFNEEDNVAECYEALKAILERDLPAYDREHIFCDNASTDSTVETLRKIAAGDPAVRIIVNSRNFGILRNTYNGVMAARGDAVVLFMPADLQDPPEILPRFVELWEMGNEVVFGIRAQREEAFLWRWSRRLYYRLISRLSYVDYPVDVGDYQLVDRKVINAMKLFEDTQPFMRMMTFECGFRSVGVPYTWRARKRGVSRNRLSQLIDQGLNGIISFSSAPVRLASLFGFLISVSSVMYALAVAVLVTSGLVEAPQGVPTLIVALFFFGGVQLFFLGLIGEYIVAIFNQVRKRPVVIERERVNF